MAALLVIIFLISYLCIALEHPLRVNKAATALFAAVALWSLYMLFTPDVDSGLAHLHEHLGGAAEILFFLIGAMTIVELIDLNGGFDIITNRITTRNKKKLLWITGLLTFFMSSILDNLTTAIVMTALLSKLIGNYKERWVFAGIIIIAANSGGAWSPIGDVTTIMLWARGNITAGSIAPALFLPSFVSFLVPVIFAQRWLHGDATVAKPERLVAVRVVDGEVSYQTGITRTERLSILILGIGCLIFVPVFKAITHLPPYMGVLGALGIMWLYTEVMYRRSKLPEKAKHRIPEVLSHIDTPTVLFFLGILLAVGALQVSGILSDLSAWLDAAIHDAYLINLIIGVLSSVVDNVPLVAGAIAAYPTADAAAIAASADPGYLRHFMQDGVFWEFLAYCAGVGGSMLIIGSAAGVVVMGLERMNFVWYLKNISRIALTGYLAGATVYILQNLIVR